MSNESYIESMNQFKDPRPIIGQIQDLQTFAMAYENEKLHSHLLQLSREFIFQRTVRGDGDCFYRSVAFLYLSECSLDSYDGVFRTIVIDTKGMCLPIAIEMRMNALYNSWRDHLLPLCGFPRSIRENRLKDLFNQQPFFDALLIAYLRTLTSQYFIRNAHCFQNYLSTNHHSLNQVDFNCFRRETEEIEIKACALALGITIKVMVVMESSLTQKVYGNGFLCITLFYRPGHYEIIYKDKPMDKIQSQIVIQQQSREKSINNVYLKTHRQYVGEKRNQQKIIVQKNIEIKNLSREERRNKLKDKRQDLEVSFGRKVIEVCGLLFLGAGVYQFTKLF